MRYIVPAKQVHSFKFCPYCGAKFVTVYDGDFCGYTQCLECDDELEFDILEEIRARYPERFKKEMFE